MHAQSSTQHQELCAPFGVTKFLGAISGDVLLEVEDSAIDDEADWVALRNLLMDLSGATSLRFLTPDGKLLQEHNIFLAETIEGTRHIHVVQEYDAALDLLSEFPEEIPQIHFSARRRRLRLGAPRAAGAGASSRSAATWR